MARSPCSECPLWTESRAGVIVLSGSASASGEVTFCECSCNALAVSGCHCCCSREPGAVSSVDAIAGTAGAVAETAGASVVAFKERGNASAALSSPSN